MTFLDSEFLLQIKWKLLYENSGEYLSWKKIRLCHYNVVYLYNMLKYGFLANEGKLEETNVKFPILVLRVFLQ